MIDKYIFLDIDGVLNHQQYYKTDRHKKGEYPYSEIDPEKVELLNSLIEQTGAKVICSSTWRIGETPERIQEILTKRGYKHSITDNTPSLRYKGDYGTVPRGCEIHAWLGNKIPYEEREKIRYIILDDDSDMMLWQKNNYFRVDGYCGLTPNIIYRAVRYLNKYDEV